MFICYINTKKVNFIYRKNIYERRAHMDQIKLGKRIREARLAKKMTQSEVVGTFITRNMLSQIESGSASPSIKTLEYLSKVLEISLPELMAEEEPTNDSTQVTAALDTACASAEQSFKEPIVFPDLQKLPASNKQHSFVTDSYLLLKQHFLQENHKEIPILIEEYLQESHPFYDEGCAIYARSCLILGLKAYEAKEYRQGMHFAKEASHYAQLGCLASRDIKTQALLLLDSITEKM